MKDDVAVNRQTPRKPLTNTLCNRQIKSDNYLLLNIYLYGARGRTRTGTVLPPRDFHTHHSFHCHAGALWGLDFIFAVAPQRYRQEPSSLYTFHGKTIARLSSGLPRINGGFPEFDSIHSRGFPPGCSNYLSPLRLPISPPGLSGRRCDYIEENVQLQ